MPFVEEGNAGPVARPTACRKTELLRINCSAYSTPPDPALPPVLFFARTPSPQEKTYQARLCALVRGLS
jgi:hypothetical protein